jgi:hypothetical protein
MQIFPRPVFSEQSLSASSPAQKNQVPIRTAINWNLPIAETTTSTFGVCDYDIAGVEGKRDLEVFERFRKTGIRLLRIRGTGLMDRWVDPSTLTWDEQTVSDALSNTDHFTIILNLPIWPSWMKQDGNRLLCASEYTNYARLCASLVELINIKLKRSIHFWELMYELDERYRKAGREQDLWRLYNTVAAAMKQKDPQIKVGGPAIASGDPVHLASFLSACKSTVDFVSWHDYTRTACTASTEALMEATNRYRYRVKAIQALVKTCMPGRKVPLILSEFNLEFMPRSANNRGSRMDLVWLASVCKHLAEAGIEKAAISHFKDNHMGLFYTSGGLRPIATLLTWLQKYLVGKVCQSTVDHPMVEVLAIQGRQKVVLLINKSEEDVSIYLEDAQSIAGRDAVVVNCLPDGSEQRSGIHQSRVYKQPIALAALSLKLILL